MKAQSLEYLLQRKSWQEPRINIGCLLSPTWIARNTVILRPDKMAELSFRVRWEISSRLVEVATRGLNWSVAGGLASI